MDLVGYMKSSIACKTMNKTEKLTMIGSHKKKIIDKKDVACKQAALESRFKMS